MTPFEQAFAKLQEDWRRQLLLYGFSGLPDTWLGVDPGADEEVRPDHIVDGGER